MVQALYMNIRIRISGKVQGVGFRQALQQRAQREGVHGTARNTPEGDVCVVLSGERSAVYRLIGWLSVGPAYARVRSVRVECIDDGENSFDDFKIIQ